MAAGISVLSDMSYSMSGACSGAICLEMETANPRVPTAKYTKMGETLRHVIPGHMQCSMACGGKTCKYENPSRWSDEEQAIKGIYSSWITGSLLAMARPSTETIQTYNIIEQFQRCGVKTVINLQRPGEHASCGNPLEQESGFTYRPETFMEAGIYYYNFGWKDYGVASLTTILDMVKVMSFAAQEGKLAVHCHAGLGRTGVLLACYLVFTCRMTADEAILFVRAKRPNSIQTRGQLLCVREFFQFLVPLRNVFSCAEPKACAVTLSQYLNRQRHLLHGYEARQMKNVPKIVQLVCKLLIDIAANRHEKIPEEWLEIPDLTTEVEKTISLQGLQQLGKEMRKKGIYAPPCSSHSSFPPSLQSKTLYDQPISSYNELEPLWRQQNVESRCSLSNKGSLSYSDSLLYKLEPQLYCLENLKSSRPNKCHIKHSLSLNNLTAWDLPWFSAQNNVSNIPVLDASKEEKQETLCNVFEKPQHVGQQLFSSQSSDQGRKTNCNDVFPASSTKFTLVANEEHLAEDVSVGEVNKMGGTNASFISLQSNLSADSRCLLVAKALAMDLTDKDLSSKIRRWQTELNSKEGAWDRLRMERDPLVLSSLMWSWLEQLKDPVISNDDIKALTERNVTPLNALHSLEKGHRHTLLCILDCAAHLLPLPKEVEANFLKQTIKVFTKTDPASVMSESVYMTLKACLVPLLHQLHEKAVDDSDLS